MRVALEKQQTPPLKTFLCYIMVKNVSDSKGTIEIDNKDKDGESRQSPKKG